MTWRLWMEFIIILVLSNFTTWLISWHLGRRNGEKWEKYRSETRANLDGMPYSGMFDQEAGSGEPLIVKHVRRNVRGQWTED